MDRRHLAAGEQEMWYRARGIVEFRTNQRDRAREIFEEGVRQFPASGWLNYGLGQEYEALGRIDEMAACFRHVRLEQVGSPTVLAIARYYYLWNRFELGQIDPANLCSLLRPEDCRRHVPLHAWPTDV